MARCFVLEDFSVESDADRCVVSLHSWSAQAVEAFADILCCAFESSAFRRVRSPSRSGILALGETLSLAGKKPPGGSTAVMEFLGLVTRSLTIEDSLDECHALGYHQENDEDSGKLTRTTLGKLVNQAKYKAYRQPRETIGNAVAEFIAGHPRYARATAIGCMPPHKAGKKSSLSARLLNQLHESLDLDVVPIIRVADRPAQKEIIDEDRTDGVRKRIANQKRSMSVDIDVTGHAVIVIDDLYGSGGSMQEAARALREAGASEVLGLAITKQHLFEGVSLASLD